MMRTSSQKICLAGANGAQNLLQNPNSFVLNKSRTCIISDQMNSLYRLNTEVV